MSDDQWSESRTVTGAPATGGPVGGRHSTGRPLPDASGAPSAWSEASYRQPPAGSEPAGSAPAGSLQGTQGWDPDSDPLGTPDESGRHTVPAEIDPTAGATSSYGTFLADPPYARTDSPPVPSDAGTPPGPRPTPWGRADETEVLPSPPSAIPDAGPRDTVTCPECGASQQVHLHRRDAADFCRHCDFPLFWTPSRVTRERDLGEQSEALRRLPGTVGRTTLASVPCPHCSELNAVSAQTCIRCGLPMVVVAAPPPVVYVPPPPLPVEPEPEPARGIAWWVWLLIALGAAAVVVIAVILIQGS